ncbi:hypothetical protein ACH8KY_005205 [Salmonella enterica subsp. enterica serovar Braenderup]|uniref:hypothetical protein n=1 Tax=Salmonella enterica TaxID=28901 RepID=UPI0009AEBC5B|nr:hypothetical protein [Salmonella enterica]EEI4451960.1 hypothetical protein [Salmonella enterica]
MEQSVFYHEVAYRTDSLQVSVRWMSVARWCDNPEHLQELWMICRDTAAFMVPPAEAEDPAWRQSLWARLQEIFPQALRQLLEMSGGTVLRNQLSRGDVYAGAVLHSLLKSWLLQYSRI